MGIRSVAISFRIVENRNVYEMYRSLVYTSQAEITRPIVAGSDVSLHHRGSPGICISLWDQREGVQWRFSCVRFRFESSFAIVCSTRKDQPWTDVANFCSIVRIKVNFFLVTIEWMVTINFFREEMAILQAALQFNIYWTKLMKNRNMDFSSMKKMDVCVFIKI